MLSQLRALLAVGLAVAPAAGWWMPPTLAPSLRPAHCAGTRVALSKCLAGGGRGAEGCPQPDCCDSLSLEDLRASVQTLAIDLAQQYSDDEAQIETTDARGLAPHELARERLLCARLSGLELARTRISSLGAVAGRGVFATRDIQKGELITCYPGDALIALAGPSRPWGKEDEGDDVIFGLHVPPEHAVPEACFGELVDYGIQEDETYVVIGMPQLGCDAAYAGHFINDGACLEEGAERGLPAEGAVERYLAASTARRNAENTDLDGLHMVSVATCDIPAGDEIFVTYGADYWLEFLDRHS